MPQQFPCGTQATCCGSIGQSEDEIKDLRETINKELDYQVIVLNVMDIKQMKNHSAIVRLYNSFGPRALPIIALDDEVVSMGLPDPDEAIAKLKEMIKS